MLIEKTDTLCFWLGTKRECRRYHVDNVPRRLLVTYAGQGTEWIQNQDADRLAYEAGEPNEKIVRDKSKLNLRYPVLGTDDDLENLRKKYKFALVTVGQIKSPSLRIKLFNRLKELNYKLPRIISPQSYISNNSYYIDREVAYLK